MLDDAPWDSNMRTVSIALLLQEEFARRRITRAKNYIFEEMER